MLTFGFILFPIGIIDDPICMLAAVNGPLDRFAFVVTKLNPVEVSAAATTSAVVWPTCKRFLNVTNSLLRLFRRCCK